MNFEEMSKEDLIKYIENINESNNGKYGLIWDKEKEPEKIVEECNNFIPILVKDEDRTVNNNGEDNILIEGDNFHSLNVLNYTHEGMIDIIYIDPPYNTGNKDFVYNDTFIEKDDGYRHSKWLNFMEKRLKLSRDLLGDKGVIFISIDDNEVFQLKLLCDRVFGPNNFIANLVWRKKYGGGKGTNFVVDLHEYILVYAKDKSQTKQFQIERSTEKKEIFKLEDEYIKERGRYYIRPLKSGLAYRKNLIYPIKCPDGSEIKTQWICGEDTFNEMLKEGRILFKKLKNGTYNIYKKFYENDKGGTVFPESIIYDLAYNQNGKEEIKKIFDIKEGRDVPFNNAKPKELLMYLLNFYGKKDSIVLDYFAGSGTTGQAVLELNKKDGGNRKFILCTNNENNLCTDITFQRIKTVISGKREDNSVFSDGLDGTLRYYKTEFIDNKGTRDQIYYDLTEKCIPMLCIKQNTYEIVEKNSQYEIYTNKEKDKYTCVYFDTIQDRYDEFIEKVKLIEAKKVLYIFTLGNKIDEPRLKEMKNYTIEAIPQRIYDLYKKLTRMSKEM